MQSQEEQKQEEIQQQQQQDISEELNIPDVKQSEKDKENAQKGTGYRYWADPSKQDANYKPKQPKKIDPEQLKKQEQFNKNKASAWNQSGTWEEKSIKAELCTPFVEKALKLKEDNKFGTQDKQIVFTEIKSLGGTLSMVYRRNKWCPGYNLNIDLAYIGQGPLEGAEGILKLTELQDDGDYEFFIEHGSEDNKDQITSSISQSLESIYQQIKIGIIDLAEH